MSKKDPLGRPVRYDDDAPKRRQVLTDDEINAIAAEARARPLGEIGRHVFPLIQHIAGLDLRQCGTCQHWVAYDRPDGEASRGECTSGEVRAKVRHPGMEAGDVAPPLAILTPFDWSCAGYAERAAQACDAQASSS